MMPRARSASAFVLFIGLVVGTLSDRSHARAVVRSGEFQILSADFHVHAFPGDGSLAVWELRREAGRAGLDVFAVTNHNQTLAARLVRSVSRFSEGPLTLVGEEITNPAYHLIAVGIEHTIDHNQPAASAIRDVHAQGGVAIAAHPVRAYWGGFDAEAMASLDGAERAHPAMHARLDRPQQLEAFFARARERNPRIAAIGSSDFHASPALGLCRTYVLARERSQAGVLDAIRNGRTVAADGRGVLHGDATWVRLVEAAAPPGRSNENSALRRLAITCAWAGLLGLILCGGRSLEAPNPPAPPVA
jgi:predicted metal-dependent phosphoesterase TrpH